MRASASGALWQMESTTSEEMRNQIVEYYNGANAGKNQAGVTNIYNLTGYTCRKYVHPRDARTGSNARTVTKTFPIIRYAEILLSYAEALNNLTTTHEVNGESYSRDESAMAEAFNQVRYRAGLPGAEAAELANPGTFNELIQRERMVEFLHENRRYYDICRWGIFRGAGARTADGPERRCRKVGGILLADHHLVPHHPRTHVQVRVHVHAAAPRRAAQSAEPDQNPGWEK